MAVVAIAVYSCKKDATVNSRTIDGTTMARKLKDTTPPDAALLRAKKDTTPPDAVTAKKDTTPPDFK